MVDIIDKNMAFLKENLRGGFLRNRELFKGVRELVDDLDKITKLEKNVEKAEKLGNAPDILKSFSKEFKTIDDFEIHIKESVMILLLYAHKMKEDFIKMDIKAEELKKEGFSNDDITRYKVHLIEESKKLNDILGTIAAVAASVERE